MSTGHLISARILGFETGEVVLKLFHENGEHPAWSEVFIETPLHMVEDIADFLERRIVVLFSGAMSEACCVEDVGGDYVEQICFKSEGGGRDEGKSHEFIALRQNICQPDKMESSEIAAGRSSLYRNLRSRAEAIVRQEFGLIDGVAADYADELKPNSRGWSWGREKTEVDTLPTIEARFPQV